MKSATATLLAVTAFLVFGIGAVFSFFTWNTGVALMLIAVGIACVARYRSDSPRFAGSLALIPLVIISVYAYGAADRQAPVYHVNVSPIVWTIILVGSLSLTLGLLLPDLFRPSSEGQPKRLEYIDTSYSGVFFWLGVFAVTVAAVNYITGDIPLLSDDINGARFVGDNGMLARLWSVVHPITQMSVIVALLKMQSRRIDLRWTVLGLSSAASLPLAGGRSLLIIPLIAFGVLLIELKRPNMRVVLITMMAGLVLFGLAGQVREMSSGGARQAQSYLSQRGLDSWSGSADLSLQTGPRVLTLAIAVLNGERLRGKLLIGDLPKVKPADVPGSDRLVTELIGRDPTVVGGSPPTVFGGFYLDFGWWGVATGALLLGFLLTFSRIVMYATRSLPASVWFGYVTAYIAISGYSYVSLRPSWIVVLMVCLGTHKFVKETHGPRTSCVQIPQISGRSRAPHR